MSVSSRLSQRSGLAVPSSFQSWGSVASLALPGANLPVIERMPFAPDPQSQPDGSVAVTPSESTAFDLMNADHQPPKPQKKMVGIRGKEVYEIVRNFTHPSSGDFPFGVSPKTIYAEILRSSVLPNWTRNQLQVELYRGVKLGRYIRVAPALYSTTENWEKRECAKLESVCDSVGSTARGQSLTTCSRGSVMNERRHSVEREPKPKSNFREAAAQSSEAVIIPTAFTHDKVPSHSNERGRCSKKMGGIDSVNNFLSSTSSMDCSQLSDDGFYLPSLKKHPVIIQAATTNVRRWTASQVRKFIANLGFAEEAKAFEEESIDGESLFLLKRAHFVSRLGIQVGPALCIFRRIKALKAIIDKEQD